MFQPKQQTIDEWIDRGIEALLPSRLTFKERLSQGPITIYHGIDPTGPTLHLGHMIALMKLRELQEMGHKVILLIGDFTAMIGDPTDKKATRKVLTEEQVKENYRLYESQAGKFLRFTGENAVQFLRNSAWLAPLTLSDVLTLASKVTVQQMLERDMFEARMNEGKPIHLHEFMYPLMQGYDSVVLDVDAEMGGNDQLFNMMVGRDLLREMKQKEKWVLTMKLLVDPTGKKMGKSEGNMVTLLDAPAEIFGKVMSWTDDMIGRGFELLTRVPMNEVRVMEKAMKDGSMNPRDAKARLGREIVTILYDEASAVQAEEAFVSQFAKKEIPDEMPEVSVTSPTSIVDVLVTSGLAKSKSEARQLIDGGGVKWKGEVVAAYDVSVTSADSGSVLQKGKRGFVRIV